AACANAGVHSPRASRYSKASGSTLSILRSNRESRRLRSEADSGLSAAASPDIWIDDILRGSGQRGDNALDKLQRRALERFIGRTGDMRTEQDIRKLQQGTVLAHALAFEHVEARPRDFAAA